MFRISKNNFLLIGLFFLGLGIGIIVSEKGFGFTGNVIDAGFEELGNSSYTRAVCNSNGECFDIVVYCFNQEVQRIEPIARVVSYNLTEEGVESGNNSFCRQQQKG